MLFVEKEALLHWQKQPCTSIQWKEIRMFSGTGLGLVEKSCPGAGVTAIVDK